MLARMVYGGGLALVVTHLFGQGQVSPPNCHSPHHPDAANHRSLDPYNPPVSPSAFDNQYQPRTFQPSTEQRFRLQHSNRGSNPYRDVAPSRQRSFGNEDYRPMPRPTLPSRFETNRRVPAQRDYYQPDPAQQRRSSNRSGWNI